MRGAVAVSWSRAAASSIEDTTPHGSRRRPRPPIQVQVSGQPLGLAQHVRRLLLVQLRPGPDRQKGRRGPRPLAQAERVAPPAAQRSSPRRDWSPELTCCSTGCRRCAGPADIRRYTGGRHRASRGLGSPTVELVYRCSACRETIRESTAIPPSEGGARGQGLGGLGCPLYGSRRRTVYATAPKRGHRRAAAREQARL